jgi:hypothetical protein
MMNRKPDFFLPIHSAKLFTWTGKKGVTEASTLGRGHTGRVWKDACDTGFNVKSPKTGRTVAFSYAFAVGESVEDIQAFVYRDIEGLDLEVHVLCT